MMKFVGMLGMMCALAAMSGCATGPAFTGVEPPPAQMAQVYLYRTWQFPGGAASLKISQDGKQTDKTIANSSWERMVVTPGRHSFALKEYLNTFGCGGAQVEIEAGQTLYFGVDFSLRSTTGTNSVLTCRLVRREETLALKDLAGMRRSN